MYRPAAAIMVGMLAAVALAVFAPRPVAAGPADQRGTTLTVAFRSDGTSVRVVATLRDARGRPLAGRPVAFSRRTAFGWLAAGTVATDASGTVSIGIPGQVTSVEVRAEFAGASGLGPSRATARWQAAALQPLKERPGSGALRSFTTQAELISPYPPRGEIFFLALVLGGVWGTYVYVGYQLARVRRAARPAPSGVLRSRTSRSMRS